MEILQLGCTVDKLIYSAFLNGLLAGCEYVELCCYPPKMAQDMWKVVKTFATRDDAFRQKNEQEHTEEKSKEDRSHN